MAPLNKQLNEEAATHMREKKWADDARYIAFKWSNKMQGGWYVGVIKKQNAFT